MQIRPVKATLLLPPILFSLPAPSSTPHPQDTNRFRRVAAYPRNGSRCAAMRRVRKPEQLELHIGVEVVDRLARPHLDRAGLGCAVARNGEERTCAQPVDAH